MHIWYWAHIHICIFVQHFSSSWLFWGCVLSLHIKYTICWGYCFSPYHLLFRNDWKTLTYIYVARTPTTPTRKDFSAYFGLSNAPLLNISFLFLKLGKDIQYLHTMTSVIYSFHQIKIHCLVDIYNPNPQLLAQYLSDTRNAFLVIANSCAEPF